MSTVYNKSYYKNYIHGFSRGSYEETPEFKLFFSAVAERIADDLHPETVLDAGCATGYLVEALRERGIQAYGVDVSEYAISKVREDIRPFCFVGSLTEPLPEGMPEQFDLVVTIEVLEHLSADDGKRAIENLAGLTDRILFSSTPDGFDDPTHLNVQQREYWARVFAEAGFLNDVSYQPSYITSYAVCFVKSNNYLRQIEDYERLIRLSEQLKKRQMSQWNKAVEDKERHIKNLEAAAAGQTAKIQEQAGIIEDKERHIQNISGLIDAQASLIKAQETKIAEQNACLSDQALRLEESKKRVEGLSGTVQQLNAELAHYKEHYFAAINQREELKQQLANVQNSYDEIRNAFFWKITKPFRCTLIAIRALCRRSRFLCLIGNGWQCLQENGFRYTWRKVGNKLWHRQVFTEAALLPYTEEQLALQRDVVFPRDVLISILVPLYNTPEAFLRDMIRSVLSQTYANWELCLADGSDDKHAHVGKICRRYASKDSRIHYQKLEKNFGISGNTNACIDMAAGDYIAFFDHDDLLHPAVLFEVMKAICDKNADFIYTDESTFHLTPEDAYLPHFKPDYAPDTLRGNNYICHLSVVRRNLLDEAGRLDPECDGSQDHDLILRLTEKAKHIVHIPIILYYWRSHPGSVADDPGVKPYVAEAGIRAVTKHLLRLGQEGTVEQVGPGLTIYRIRYALRGTPKISVLIPNYEHSDDLRKCLDSIFEKTTYPNYEIVIVENNSFSPEVFSYYDLLQKTHDNVKVIEWQGTFNYSAINNYGSQVCSGEYLLLLNNDVEIITPDWIQEMLMYAQREDVGAVGAKLYYPDNTIQHAGVILGMGGVAGHCFRNVNREHVGYMGRLIYAQNLSAVTAACFMMRRSVWEEVGGLDESFAVAFNDVDMCIRIRNAGYLIVWTPFAELYHYESKSRGIDDTAEKQKRFESETRRFQTKWARELATGDPYYNPNLTLERSDFSRR